MTADPGRAQALRDAAEFRRLVQTADVVDVGTDTDYVPDGPHARDGHPNVEGNE